MRPHAPYLPNGAFLTHHDHQTMRELNAHYDAIDLARTRIERQLRRGVPLDPEIAYVPEAE